MLRISIPDSANSRSPVSLGGETYEFEFQYNTVDQVYRLNIYYQGELMLGSIDLKMGSLLTGKYDLPNFSHGELFLEQFKATDEPPSRNNVGVGKAYELVYMTTEEIKEA